MPKVKIIACSNCGREKRHAARGMCSACYNYQMKHGIIKKLPGRLTSPEFVEEVEFLAGTDTPKSLAKRLGCATPDRLYERLLNAGRKDLWKRVLA